MASRGIDKFAGVSWEPAPATGSPMIEGTLGYVDCQIHTSTRPATTSSSSAGCSTSGSTTPSNPLLFFQGKYASTEA